MGRARRENTRQRILGIASGMNLEDVAPGLVKPGDDEDFAAGRDPEQGRRGPSLQLEPGIGSSLDSLFWSLPGWTPGSSECCHPSSLSVPPEAVKGGVTASPPSRSLAGQVDRPRPRLPPCLQLSDEPW